MNKTYEREADAAKAWNTRHAEPLQWTKEPPAEKDWGGLFVVRGMSYEDQEYHFGRIDADFISFWLEEYMDVEFFGPLPE